MTKCLIQLHDTEYVKYIYEEIPQEPIIVELEYHNHEDYMWYYPEGDNCIYYHNGFKSTPESHRIYNFTILMVK